MAERQKKAAPPNPAPKQAPKPAPAGNSLYERYKDALRRGHVASLRGRYETAIGAYTEASAIASDRALPHTSIGGILLKMGRPADALESFGRALAIAPRDEQALRGRADLLAADGRRVEAADLLDRLADVLDDAGRLPEASDAARRALELAESRERRRQVEAFAERLRASEGDEAAERALAQVLRVLEPTVVAAPVLDAETVPEAPSDGAALDGADEAAEGPSPEPEPSASAEPEAGPVPDAPVVADAAADEVLEPEPEPEIDAFTLGQAAEDALAAGDAPRARDGLLAAAAAHRRAGRSFAAIDACYLALAVAPADVDLHVLLTELYLDRGWRGPAVDKLLLLGRLADLGDDPGTRERLCAIASDQLPDEPRLTELCA